MIATNFLIDKALCNQSCREGKFCSSPKPQIASPKPCDDIQHPNSNIKPPSTKSQTLTSYFASPFSKQNTTIKKQTMSFLGIGRPQPTSEQKIAAVEGEMRMMADTYNR